MMTDTKMTPEQQLALERMECVCRVCHAEPISKRRRFYCASCGKPLAYPAGTVPLSRPEALEQARATERARCAAITERFTNDHQDHPVQITARAIRAAIEEG